MALKEPLFQQKVTKRVARTFPKIFLVPPRWHIQVSKTSVDYLFITTTPISFRKRPGSRHVNIKDWKKFHFWMNLHPLPHVFVNKICKVVFLLLLNRQDCWNADVYFLFLFCLCVENPGSRPPVAICNRTIVQLHNCTPSVLHTGRWRCPNDKCRELTVQLFGRGHHSLPPLPQLSTLLPVQSN